MLMMLPTSGLLMMLPSCLVKCAHSLGQMLLQHLESRAPCGRKCTQLMLMMLPSCLAKCVQSLGQMLLQHLESRAAMCRKCTQLMLMMLPSCLVKCAQSLGQMVLQLLESRRAMWPEMYPADSHDAPLLPGKMRAITGADGFATSGV